MHYRPLNGVTQDVCHIDLATYRRAVLVLLVEKQEAMRLRCEEAGIEEHKDGRV